MKIQKLIKLLNSWKFTFCVFFYSPVFTFGQSSITSSYPKTLFFELDKDINFKLDTSYFCKDSSEYTKNYAIFFTRLKAKGYWTALASKSFDSINMVIFQVVLNKKFEKIIVSINQLVQKEFQKINVNPKELKNLSTPDKLSDWIDLTLKKASNTGYPFASIAFNNTKELTNQFEANLDFVLGPKILWLEPEIKSKDLNISKQLLLSVLQIKVGEVYSEDQRKKITQQLAQVPFLKEAKPHELIFTDEGAKLYVYISSKKSSNFSGILGLQRNAISLKYNLTGEIRLKLVNPFKYGEQFFLHWRNTAVQSPQLNTSLYVPYLFKTPFGIEGQFQLVKRDTTFLETKAQLGFTYTLAYNHLIKGFYRNYQSNLIGNNAGLLNYGTIKNNQYGLSWRAQEVDYIPSPKKGIIYELEFLVGTRTQSSLDSSNQSLIYGSKASLEYYINFKKRFVFKTSVNFESYTSPNLKTNELLRFGGNQNLRGFNEDELLASTKAIFSLEPRFLLDELSYFFAFYDIAIYEQNLNKYQKDIPMGIGLGLAFGTKAGVFSITYALGKQFQNSFLLRDSKIHFGYNAIF